MDDVVITSGCSGAIEIAIGVLANEGDNILIPAPGFSIYQTICEHKGVEAKFYRLLVRTFLSPFRLRFFFFFFYLLLTLLPFSSLSSSHCTQPEREWEVDLAHLESLINAKTKAILVNNPSNPCGSVYSKEHLEDILAIAAKHRIPIIADEIYGGLVFEGRRFFPLASLSKVVPILSVGGISKEFLVPGWRLGWVLAYDKNGVFQEVKFSPFSFLLFFETLQTHKQQIGESGHGEIEPIVIGSQHSRPVNFGRYSHKNTAVVLFLCHPHLANQRHVSLHKTLQSSRTQNHRSRRCHVHDGLFIQLLSFFFWCTNLTKKKTPTQVVIDFSKFKDIADDLEFSQKLLQEELVVVLPGRIFKGENCIRLVICPPIDKLEEACNRIEAFCARHAN
jgi:tyrosine aminotransferase